MRRVIIGVLVLSVGLLLKACDATEPPPEETLVLKLEDVSCTEAWIKLTTTNLQLPTTITLKQNNQNRSTINLVKTDTLLYIDSLLPNQSYTFQSIVQSINQSSNELSVTTLDTTSHNFTFESFAFGDISNSVLFDVAIINENNIWAVGEINIADTSINGYTTYNAVHWDGSQWELKRVYFPTVCGQTSLTSYPAKAIFAFADGQVWISSSGDKIAILKNGNQINQFCLPTNVSMSINKLWGSSSNDLYVVGNNGNIAHYRNGIWSRIENGFNVDLQDIAGTPDGTGIWTCGWNYQTGQSVILKIKNLSTETIWDSEIIFPYNEYDGLLNSIYANGNSEFIFVGGQVFRQSLIDIRIVRREWIKTQNGMQVLNLGNYGYRVRASDKNNIVIVGDAAMIWHYNGKSWFKFEEVYNTDDRLYGLGVKENIIVAVGKRYGTGLGDALLITGRR